MRRSLVVGGITGLVLFGGGGAAYAVCAGAVDSGGVIYGCYTNAQIHGSHALVLQDTGTSCPSGTTAIQWNQTGSQGPEGPQGPAGPSTAGGGGLGTEIVWSTDAFANPSGAVAICPNDHPFIVGGGGDAGVNPLTTSEPAISIGFGGVSTFRVHALGNPVPEEPGDNSTFGTGVYAWLAVSHGAAAGSGTAHPE